MRISSKVFYPTLVSVIFSPLPISVGYLLALVGIKVLKKGIAKSVLFTLTGHFSHHKFVLMFSVHAKKNAKIRRSLFPD